MLNGYTRRLLDFQKMAHNAGVSIAACLKGSISMEGDLSIEWRTSNDEWRIVDVASLYYIKKNLLT